MMRRILWILIFIGAYIWLSTSGKSDWVLNAGKALYYSITDWLKDADIDFHLKAEKEKKRSRRWG